MMHGAEYSMYLEDGNVDSYRQGHIDPARAEMENLTLRLACDVLIYGAGMAVQVSYLDRSAGDKVNVHRFEPMGPDRQPLLDPPTIHLLYRP